jgi:hypothetical protein
MHITSFFNNNTNIPPQYEIILVTLRYVHINPNTVILLNIYNYKTVKNYINVYSSDKGVKQSQMCPSKLHV